MAKNRNVFRCSQSKIKLWRKCKYAAYLRYVLGLRKRVKARALQFGSLAHTMLEANIEGKNPFKALTKATTEQKLFSSEREELEETAHDARLIMREYFEYYENDPIEYINVKKKKAEHEIFVEIAPGIELQVKLDAIGETEKHGKVLVEHKTFKQLPSDDHRWRDIQSNIYKRVDEELKLGLVGTLWDYIRSKPPTMPLLLKNGTISAKRLDTLPSALKEFQAKSKNEVPKRLMDAAEANRSKWFIRKVTPFRKATLKLILEDFIESARDMAQNLGTQRSKSIDRHCDWCEFEPICRAELTGGDTKFIIKKEYTNREQREKEIEEVG